MVGRERELTDLKKIIMAPTSRLVTVTGPVGVGKTRLALQLVSDLGQEPACGDVRFYDLAHAGAGDGTEDLLGPAPLHANLVLIDHCEEDAAALSGVIARMLGTRTDLKIVAFSREPLGICGELVFRLAPLAVPAHDAGFVEVAGSPSVALFLNAARATRHDFRLTGENALSVAEICRELDGLPLPLSMAAARVKIFSPNDIHDQVHRDSAELPGGSCGAFSNKYPSLGAALEKSLLGVEGGELAVLEKLTMFRGGFTLEAAESVVGSGQGPFYRVIEHLLDKSLLLLTECADGELEFSMLRTTRAYIAKRTTSTADTAAARRYVAYFYKIAEKAAAASGQRRYWRDRLARYRDDLSQCCRLLIEFGDHCGAVRLLHLLRGCSTSVLAACDERRILEAALSRGSRPALQKAMALQLLGALDLAHRPEDARRRLLDALATVERLHDQAEIGRCHALLGRVALTVDDLPAAEHHLGTAIQADPPFPGHHHALRDLAKVRLLEKDLEQAEALGERSLRAALDAGDGPAAALSLFVLAESAVESGDLEGGRGRLAQALSFLRWPADREEIITGLELVAVLLPRVSTSITQWQRTAKVLAAALAAREDAAGRNDDRAAPLPESARVGEITGRVKQKIGVVAFSREVAESRYSPVTEVFSDALLWMTPDGDEHLPGRRSHAPLTPREFEVARLVSQGLTNRAIGRRLGIAEWTVVNHLRKIMKKLDCSSRLLVAKWVLDTD
ncbi:hypothetical protein E1264_04290 [Actinomadura sp. KC216]|uniref:LuxR C-terminal-related transcriptional regulator n=1 Tax=Actinomadura sp. KC216 TaxID=2530370 RepID=UPI0010D34C83|nr:LuxR C-terminal-related transcriptional regulator [Actinomadura sp. KC216]TDB90700.1 hypothetical protein E1264_04290 [Actinomadura sp. KC216]